MSSLIQFAAELPEAAQWSAAPTEAECAALPAAPAVYLLVDAGQRPVQLATTQHLRRAVTNRLTPAADGPTKRADLAAIVRGVRWREVAAPIEARWWYFRLCRIARPREYRELISFGPAHFLHVDWAARAPEPRVSERVYREAGEFLGPWPSRAECQRALEGLWDLFDLCRYPEQVRRAPQGQRCAYAEMGRCDAPCDGGAPLADYIARCRAAWRFARGEIDEWVADAQARMKQAALQQKFEHAGLLKQQIEFARKWNANWAPRVRRAELWTTFFAVPVARRRAWRLLLFDRGILIDGPIRTERKLGADVPAWLTAALAASEDAAPLLDAGLRMEQSWLMAHFLNCREAEAAVVIELPDRTLPPDITVQVAARLAELRKRPAATARDAPGFGSGMSADLGLGEAQAHVDAAPRASESPDSRGQPEAIDDEGVSLQGDTHG